MYVNKSVLSPYSPTPSLSLSLSLFIISFINYKDFGNLNILYNHAGR